MPYYIIYQLLFINVFDVVDIKETCNLDIQDCFATFLQIFNCLNMSSDSGDSDREWEFYKDRAEWKDVKPIPQDEDSNSVVRIAYSDKCR